MDASFQRETSDLRSASTNTHSKNSIYVDNYMIFMLSAGLHLFHVLCFIIAEVLISLISSWQGTEVIKIKMKIRCNDLFTPKIKLKIGWHLAVAFLNESKSLTMCWEWEVACCLVRFWEADFSSDGFVFFGKDCEETVKMTDGIFDQNQSERPNRRTERSLINESTLREFSRSCHFPNVHQI